MNWHRLHLVADTGLLPQNLQICPLPSSKAAATWRKPTVCVHPQSCANVQAINRKVACAIAGRVHVSAHAPVKSHIACSPGFSNEPRNILASPRLRVGRQISHFRIECFRCRLSRHEAFLFNIDVASSNLTRQHGDLEWSPPKCFLRSMPEVQEEMRFRSRS